MSASQAPQATLTHPLDALLLGKVRAWILVVFRQKRRCGQLDVDGRPWSRCPATDLARQLEEQDGLQVGIRRIQRSLARLAEAGLLARQRRGIWRRDFWYSFPDQEWEMQRCRPVSLARDRLRRNDATAVTHINLGINSGNQNLSRRGQPKTKTETGAVEVAEGSARPSGASARPVRGFGRGSGGRGRQQGLLEAPEAVVQQLDAIVSRCFAKGGLDIKNPSFMQKTQ